MTLFVGALQLGAWLSLIFAGMGWVAVSSCGSGIQLPSRKPGSKLLTGHTPKRHQNDPGSVHPHVSLRSLTMSMTCEYFVLHEKPVMVTGRHDEVAFLVV